MALEAGEQPPAVEPPAPTVWDRVRGQAGVPLPPRDDDGGGRRLGFFPATGTLPAGVQVLALMQSPRGKTHGGCSGILRLSWSAQGALGGADWPHLLQAGGEMLPVGL